MRMSAPLWRTLDKLSIRARMYGAFALVIGLSAVLGLVAITALTRVNNASSDLATKWLPGVQHLADARMAMQAFRELEIKHTNALDASYLAEYEDKMAAAANKVTQSMAAHLDLGDDDKEVALSKAMQSSWQAYNEQSKKVVALSHENKQQDARDISDGASKDLFDTAIDGVDKLSASYFTQGQRSAQTADGTFKQARWVVGGMVAISLVMGIGMALLITGDLIGQLGGEPANAVALVKAVAEGDLRTRIQLRPGDRTSLMACLQAMQHSLSEVVSSVRVTSESVATASAEIAQGNNDLSSRTEMQASALQQTAASMEQLGSTVTQNADNARQANTLATQASEIASAGGSAVNEVVRTMKGITDSSRRIADITGVIDGIAFQTNILALNAAVEAARAGEQGRGFAVVATEVRSLAQRSATAAKEIKSLITASVEQVQAGSAQVDRAGETMEQVVQAIRRVSDIVTEISTASAEQSDGVNQVSDAVSQMDQATQQNAALVEQSAAAAESLKHQSHQLVGAVAVFRTV
jgi:methyl-accepting chemotaxis protein